MIDMVAVSVEQAYPQSRTKNRGRLLYWLLGVCVFPALDVPVLWWLGARVVHLHTVSWNLATVAWFGTLAMLLGLESLALLKLRHRWAPTTPENVLGTLMLLSAMSLFWLCVEAVVYVALVLVTGPHIPPD